MYYTKLIYTPKTPYVVVAQRFTRCYIGCYIEFEANTYTFWAYNPNQPRPGQVRSGAERKRARIVSKGHGYARAIRPTRLRAHRRHGRVWAGSQAIRTIGQGPMSPEAPRRLGKGIWQDPLNTHYTILVHFVPYALFWCTRQNGRTRRRRVGSRSHLDPYVKSKPKDINMKDG